MKKLAIALLTIASGSAHALVSESTQFTENLDTACGIEMVSGQGGVGFIDRAPAGFTKIKVFTNQPNTTKLKLGAVKHNLGDDLNDWSIIYQVRNQNTIFINGFDTYVKPVNGVWEQEVYVFLNQPVSTMTNKDLFVDTAIEVSCDGS